MSPGSAKARRTRGSPVVNRARVRPDQAIRKTVDVVDRRRTRRRALHESQLVELHASNDDSDHTLRAVLLNLSGHGLACRLSENEARSLRAGANVRTVFRLDGNGPKMNIAARVINLTSTHDSHCIVGLEFIADDDEFASQRIRLRRALGSDAGSAGSSTD